MAAENDGKTREQELKDVPPRKVRKEDWPPGVREIGVGEMNAIGVDVNGMLYWHGQPVAMRIKLRKFELWLAVLATLGTLMSGVAAMFPRFPAFITSLVELTK